MRQLILLLPAAWLLVGCATAPPKPADRPVTHVVVCWLKNPGDAAARARVVAGARELDRIPGVLRVQSGECIPSNRPAVVADYDVAVVMEFANERALRAYEQHPAHLAAVRDVLLPLVARYQVFDFVRGH